ncbi:zinc ribbon-containing protein [Tissierella sp. MSJ-40]|uniref:Zinc ribbon-containing protein n=1 Tax=Tissierella simiarum TaxID=2841534 RepID=A0ABS6E7U9_9FIRM|nr:zinc ribbon-containing protein [Tissierella simiarum]MBU5438324.1 zinc ribbon-containing protein [Tissierella simiarum]
MSYEKTYYVPNEDEKELVVKPGTYFCYKCNAKQEIFFKESPLKPCIKCECRVFVSI